MSEEPNQPKSPAMIQAVAELSKAVPIYQDALQPMMQESGKALSVVGRAVNVAIAPLRGLVWGAERVEEWLVTKVEEKLSKSRAEDIVQPDLSIAGPLIEALKFNGHKPELSEMYASLLAGSMQKSTVPFAHPTFVEKIRAMTTLDARIFQFLAVREALPTVAISIEVEGVDGGTRQLGYFNPALIEIGTDVIGDQVDLFQLVEASIENLAFLGLVEPRDDGYLTSDNAKAEYAEIEAGPVCEYYLSMSVPGKHKFSFKKTYLRVTQMGKNFRRMTSL